MGTGISYVHETLNPIVGCDPSMSCAGFCWARRTVNRLAGKFPEYKICLNGSEWSGDTLSRLGELDKLAHWKKGKRIFMVAQGDLFGENVNVMDTSQVIDAMVNNRQHRYLVLTKQFRRMVCIMNLAYNVPRDRCDHIAWGVSVMVPGDIDRLNEFLALDPAFKLWISFEPLLAPVSHLLTPTMLKRLSWIVVGCLKLSGGKTGGWVKDYPFAWWGEVDHIISRCVCANVPMYLKQVPCDGTVVSGAPCFQAIPDFLTLPWEK